MTSLEQLSGAEFKKVLGIWFHLVLKDKYIAHIESQFSMFSLKNIEKKVNFYR